MHGDKMNKPTSNVSQFLRNEPPSSRNNILNIVHDLESRKGWLLVILEKKLFVHCTFYQILPMNEWNSKGFVGIHESYFWWLCDPLICKSSYVFSCL